MQGKHFYLDFALHIKVSMSMACIGEPVLPNQQVMIWRKKHF